MLLPVLKQPQGTTRRSEERLLVCVPERTLDRGYSQEELERLSGISRATISHLEGGTRPHPHPRTLRKLAEALGVAVADIRKRD